MAAGPVILEIEAAEAAIPLLLQFAEFIIPLFEGSAHPATPAMKIAQFALQTAAATVPPKVVS